MNREVFNKFATEVIYDKLGCVYCDSCKFQNLSKDEARKKYDYHGCEDCHRKMIGWEASEEFSSLIADSIWTQIYED